MSKAVTDTKYYNEIAKRMLSKGAISNTIPPTLTPAEMIEAVEDVAVFQYGNGHTEGRQAERTIFWEALQNHGNGIYGTYRRFHGANWTDEAYQPIYPMKSLDNSMSQLYFSSGITDTKVPLILEGVTSTGSMLAWSSIHTIPLLVVDEATNFAECFRAATYLKNIVFSGTIGNNLSMSDCSELTSESVDSIIDALKKLEKEDEARTLTLHKTVKENMTETQTATIAEKGWTLA